MAFHILFKHTLRPHMQKTEVVLPDKIAAEEEAKDEDENGGPKDDNVDVQRKVLEPYIRHPETMMKI